MHDAAILRTKFGAVQIHVVIQPGGKHEASILIRAIRRQRVFHRNGQHLIGLAGLPSVRELRRRRLRGGISFGSARFGPIFDQGNLRVRKTALAGEISESRLGLPGRHKTAADRPRNQRRSFRGVLVTKQGKWRNFTGAMAGGAVGVEDGRDVFIERGRGTGSRRGVSGPRQRQQQ